MDINANITQKMNKIISEVINIRSARLDLGQFDRYSANYLFTICTLLCLCAIGIGFFIDIDTTTQIRGYLDVNTGNRPVQAPSPGILLEWIVKQGDHVKKGDNLGFVSTEKIGVGGLSLSQKNIFLLGQQRLKLFQSINDLKIFLNLYVNNCDSQQLSINSQITVILNRYKAKKQEIDIHKIQLKRAKKLNNLGYLSTEDVEVKESENLQIQDGILSMDQQLRSLQTTLIDSKQICLNRKISTMMSIQSIRQNIIDIDKKINQLETDSKFVIVAPISGIVSTLNVLPGNYVDSTRSIATINGSFKNNLIGRLIIPPKGLGQIQLGGKVSLQLDAFPYRQYGFLSGKISHIDSSYINPKDQVGPININEPVYYGTITLDNNVVKHMRLNLRPGMTFYVHVQDRRYSIFSWLANRFLNYQ